MSNETHTGPKAFVAGVTSGALTNLLLHPLDSVKTRLQAQGRTNQVSINSQNLGIIRETVYGTKNVIQNEGWRALYQGLGSSVTGAGISWGLYFFIYKSVKARYDKEYGINDVPAKYLTLSSACAGVVTCLITHPIWLIKTRMQLQNRKSMEKIVDLRGKPIVPYRNSFDAVRNIVRDEGMTSLYIGLAPSLLLISHGMINFVCYDKLKSAYLKQFEKDRLNAAESFVIGGVTKMVAAVSTYPLQVVKTRLQDQRNRYDTVRYTGMYDAMVKMYRYEGYRTFFRGIVPHVIRTSPSAAITFMLYEEIMAIMNKMV